ncbi:MAG TPA: cadherin repeat domain-containing protein, partial [Microvirga sp.]|nr:cadherin repeat domain-containing protein [Microvirga sp.]
MENEPTITISAISAAEDATGELATLACEGAVTYALVGADDSTLALFEIVDDKLVLKEGASFDYEAMQGYVFSIQALDGEGNLLATYAFTAADPFVITDVNDNAPTGVTLSDTTVSEAAEIGDVVGVLVAEDVDT